MHGEPQGDTLIGVLLWVDRDLAATALDDMPADCKTGSDSLDLHVLSVLSCTIEHGNQPLILGMSDARLA